MTVKLIWANPRQRARPLLDDVLEHGVDQLAIACAFLTGGGVELRRRHETRLKLPSSFLTVAWEWPTNLAAVEELHELCPGNVYLHLGAQTPVEKGVGPGLMHSKLFFARTDNRCWLWTGSHNLTASAAQGVNCEAAVLLEGTMDEQPFQEALAHLIKCKGEAVVFDPYHPPPIIPESPAQQTLVIHAECDVALKTPPWFVHLRPATTDYDRVMRPPASRFGFTYIIQGNVTIQKSASTCNRRVFRNIDRPKLYRGSRPSGQHPRIGPGPTSLLNNLETFFI